jgi:hypothetical protein
LERRFRFATVSKTNIPLQAAPIRHGNHREPHRQRGPFWTPRLGLHERAVALIGVLCGKGTMPRAMGPMNAHWASRLSDEKDAHARRHGNPFNDYGAIVGMIGEGDLIRLREGYTEGQARSLDLLVEGTEIEPAVRARRESCAVPSA